MNKNIFEGDDVDEEVRKHVIAELYSRIDLNNHKFVRICKNEDIVDLKNKKYYVSANYGGITAFLFFLKIDNRYNCFLIDRRSLSFDKMKKQKHNDVRIKKIYVSINIKFYEDTIFDCIKIDDVINGKMQIVILDCFYFCGKNVLKDNYKIKMKIISTILVKSYWLKSTDNAVLHVTPIYELNAIKHLFSDYIKINQDKLRIRGIAFYPIMSGHKIIYLTSKTDICYKEMLFSKDYSIQTQSLVTTQTNVANGNKCYKISLKDLSFDHKIILNLEIHKTQTPDVFKVYTLFDINNKIIKKKIGCAYIPNYNISLKCRNMFSEGCNKMIMECEFNNKTAKFIPIKKASIQKMHIMNKDSRLNVTENYNS